MADFQQKRKLIDFLNVMKSLKDSAFTHTSITEPAGSFYIKSEDTKSFYDLYKNSMKSGGNLYLTEKHSDISPVLIDFDFRFPLDVIERKYTIQMIEKVVTMYIEEITKYVEVPEKVEVYIMEKEAPLPIEKKNLVKDGIHIVITNIVTRPSVQYVVRTNLLEPFGKVLEEMPITNTIEDVFDEQVIEKNNWQMYGSKKPATEAYRVTHHWSVSEQVITENDILEEDSDYVEILSIRNKFIENTVKQELKSEVNKIDKILKQAEYKKDQKKQIYNKIIQTNETNFRPSCEELTLVKKLIKILAKKRGDNYADWIRLGWCLRNIHIELLNEWDEFSKQSEKYVRGCCDLLWFRMKEGGLGIGTLHMWAKTDNPVQYGLIISEDLSGLIYKSLTLTDYDIALVICKMFRHRFRCASHKHHTWYEYENHGWREKERGYTLFYIEIPTKLFNEYMKLIGVESNKALQTTCEREKDVCAKNIESLNKIAKKFKNTSFVKDKMYKECSGLFYEPKFEDKLDSNPKLLGFENGVYDLDNDEFREGRPEDYISLSTGINYIEYDVDNPYLEDIEFFMKKVLVNDNVREYVWTLFASILDGSNRDEKFHIWTGSGCHSYDTKIMMYNGKYKKVQDVCVNDVLMGDDNTKRNVEKLWRGESDMYKIIPNRGEPFIVNGDHKLSLKVTRVCAPKITTRHTTYLVRYIKLLSRDEIDGDMIKKYEKSYKTLNLAQQHLDMIEKEKDTLNINDIVDIQVKYYIEFNMKNYNLSLYRPSFVEFEDKEVSLDPYMIGYWLGDGYSQGSLFITADYEVLEYFENKLPEIDCKMTECKSDKENAKVMSISTIKNNMEKNNFTKGLIKYNLVNNKHIPDDYKLNSKEVRLQMLAGILDSDGSYQYNKDTNVNQYELTLKSEKLFDDCVFLARSLGFSAYKHQIKKKCCNNGVIGTYFRCNIYGENIHEIPCIIERKKANKTNRYFDNLAVRFTIEKDSFDKYYGVQVDGNHRYLMYDFTVTRNSNGKSKIVELFQYTIGEYACIFNVSLLTQKRVSSNSTNSELAIAKGKRFAILQEPEENERINVGLMKELTGGDQIQCRCLFKEPIRYKPMFKMILTCNHMPSIPPDDGGTWRRVRRVEYTSKFVDTPNPNVETEFKIDRELGYKFELWKETFMVMLLQQYKKYKKVGKITEPKEIMEYTNEYQRKNDVFAEFCEEYIEQDSDSVVDIGNLFEKFKEHCAVDNIQKNTKKSTFQEAMEKRYGKLVTYKGLKIWKGIKMKIKVVEDVGGKIEE
jgi:P4 family phage/plasmid primase-like protien